MSHHPRDLPSPPNATAPISGNNYRVVNLASSLWLCNSNASVSEGIPIISSTQNGSNPLNQIWKFLEYPSDLGEPVFTLQAVSALQSDSDAVIDGRGGYMRVDPSDNKLVQGGQPQAWKLLMSAGANIYKILPFEDAFSANGTLVAMDVSQSASNVSESQLQLHEDEFSTKQLWSFIQAKLD